MNRPRVILADDHAVVSDGLRRVLDPVADVVDVVHDGRALLEKVAEHRPDIAVVDISMPELNGLEAARRLRKDVPALKIIMLTQHTDIEFAEAAFEAGVHGYLIKQCAAEELTKAIETVRQGQLYLTPLVARDAVEFLLTRVTPGSKERDKLTDRQRDVLQLAAEGKSMKQIAAALHVSPKTVEFHRYNIMKALDLHTTAELTRYAVRHGIVSSE